MKLPLHRALLSQASSSSSKLPLDVLIIGAGWAGIGAANHLRLKLSSMDNNILLVEGRDYVGGRSRTITMEDGFTRAELGSQWVQGAQPSNPIYKATVKSGTDYVRCSDDWTNAVYLEGEGQRMTEEEHDRLVQELFEGPDGFFDYQSKRQEEGETDRSLRDIADQYIDSRKETMTNYEQRALEWMLDSFIAEEYAASLEDLSHWFWDDDGELEGGDLYLAQNPDSGFTSVVDHYSASVKENICLETAVLSVDWSSNPAKVQIVDRSKTNNSGKHSAILANHVLVTVPLGCLKAGSIEFVPPLPKDKLEAIDKLGMGQLSKCTFLWDETDHLPWPKDKEWIEYITIDGKQGRWTEFYSPLPLNGCRQLYAYSAGRSAEKSQTDDETKEEVLAVLSGIFGNVPEPRQVIITEWDKDEFSQGAYSFYKVGSGPEHRRALARSLKRRLYFAGEATNVEHFATAQGALLSGIRAAKEIAKDIKGSSGNPKRKRGS